MGGPFALSGLVHVPLFSGIVHGDVVVCTLSGQEMTSSNCHD